MKAKHKEVQALNSLHGITFVGPRLPKSWPDCHRETLKTVDDLGQYRYIDYEKKYAENLHGPWKRNIGERVLHLVNRVKACSAERANEQVWRLRIENLVFARFDDELVCLQCGHRLWRSEIEAPNNTGDWDRESLEKRQKNRKACQCPNSWPKDEHFDQGITPLFTFKGSEGVDADTRGHKLPGSKQPDLVIGLRKTRAFKTALDALYIHEHESCQPATTVAEAVEFTPFKDFGGEPLLFPFLVAEAKSAKASDTFDQIEIQSSFPIQSSIKLQQRLQEVVGDRIEPGRGPLVWFFSWKGEDWRLYACYTRRSKEEIKYEIMHLWSGCIIHRDDALRLLLIVDLIVDWARDKYRTQILSELKSLSQTNICDMMSIARDSDIPSQKQKRINSWAAGLPMSLDINNNTTKPGEQNKSQAHPPNFRFLDSRHGCVRRAKEIETRLRGLYITGDNVNDLIQCFANDGQVRKFAASVFDVLSECGQALHSEETLRLLELEWTENNRSIRNDSSTTYVTIRFAYYFTVEWDQVRELSYIAVTEKALTLLREYAGQSSGNFNALPADYLNEQNLLYTCRGLLRMTPLQNLAAAISRKTLIVRNRIDGSLCPSQPGAQIVEEEHDDFIWSKLAGCIIQQIYQRHKIGRREPNEYFLHISNHYSEEHPESKDACSSLESLDLANGMALICAKAISADETRNALLPCLCVYLVEKTDEKFDHAKLAAALQEFLNKPRIYFSTREGRYSEAKLSEPNNLRNTYLESLDIQLAFFRGVGISFNPHNKIMDWLIEVLPTKEKVDIIDLTIEDNNADSSPSGTPRPPALSDAQDTKPIKAEVVEVKSRTPFREDTQPAGSPFPHPLQSPHKRPWPRQKYLPDAINANTIFQNLVESKTTSTPPPSQRSPWRQPAKRNNQYIQQDHGDRLAKRRKRSD
ncbi:hypothetical protein K432DRAFT_421464 [Lepidopterella palustris CBS 459.81]|uniref:Uncharacterized protein n=1 Tax=Lepidopterella palustris CBS 459.81 TaxID=1314670 RepID=A0A8E2ELA8_9PEZI|nr:hypothetical protein K432DRAFT_421464 [Lepidopterella palustris CBS 459.81]